MNNILVTGHDGFIGSNLVNLLDSKGYSIIGLSKKHKKDKKIPQINADIKNLTHLDIDKISCIIHLAAITDFNHCQQNPLDCFETNVIGTQNLLELARKKDCDFVYVSTSHVYGEPDNLPISEEHPRKATSVYSASKIGGEVCCESYSRSYGMDITILRLFSVYGPKSPPHLVTSRIISQLLSDKSIQLGNLYPKRDFVYVSDVVKAIGISLKHLDGFNVYNIGSGKSHSIFEVCNILKKLYGSKKPIVSTKSTSRKTDIKEIVSNPSKIKKLGWKPEISLNKGLKLTLDWYKTQNVI